MLIVTVEVTIAPTDHASVIALLLGHAETIRTLPGNPSYQPLSADQDGQVLVIQRWRDASAFAAFRGHYGDGALNAELGPKLTKPPRIHQCEATELA